MFSYLQGVIAAGDNKAHWLQRTAGPGPGKERPVLTKRPLKRGKWSLKLNPVTPQRKISAWEEWRGKSEKMERDLYRRRSGREALTFTWMTRSPHPPQWTPEEVASSCKITVESLYHQDSLLQKTLKCPSTGADQS